MLIMSGVTDHFSWATLSLLQIKQVLYEASMNVPHPIVMQDSIPADVINSEGSESAGSSKLKNPPLKKPTNKKEIINACNRAEDKFPIMCLALKYELWDHSKSAEWAAWFRFLWSNVAWQFISGWEMLIFTLIFAWTSIVYPESLPSWDRLYSSDPLDIWWIETQVNTAFFFSPFIWFWMQLFTWGNYSFYEISLYNLSAWGSFLFFFFEFWYLLFDNFVNIIRFILLFPVIFYRFWEWFFNLNRLDQWKTAKSIDYSSPLIAHAMKHPEKRHNTHRTHNMNEGPFTNDFGARRVNDP